MARRQYTLLPFLILLTVVLAAHPTTAGATTTTRSTASSSTTTTTPLMLESSTGPPSALLGLAARAPPPRSPLAGTQPKIFNPWSLYPGVDTPSFRHPDWDLWLSDPNWFDSMGYDAVDQLRVFLLPSVADQAAEMVRLFREMPHRGADLLYKAVQRHSPDVMRALLAAGARPHPSPHSAMHRYGAGETPLHEAARRGCLECLAVLVDEAGVHPDAAVVVRGRLVTPLAHAAEQGRADVVAWLLGTGRVNPARVRWPGAAVGDLLVHDAARPPLLNMTPEALGWAARGGDREVLDLFLRWGDFGTFEVPPSRALTRNLTDHQLACAREALRQAAESRQYATLSALLRYLYRGENEPLVPWVDPAPHYQESILLSIHHAVWEDDVDVFRLLVHALCSLPDLARVSGDPGLAGLYQSRQHTIERLLSEASVSAAESNSVEVFTALVLEFGADVNVLHKHMGHGLLHVYDFSVDPRGDPRGPIARYLRCFARAGGPTERCRERLRFMARPEAARERALKSWEARLWEDEMYKGLA